MKLNPEELDVVPFPTTCEHGSGESLAYNDVAPEIDHGGNGPCTCWCH